FTTIVKNTAGVCLTAGGAQTSEERRTATSKKKETEVSLKLTIMLLMKKYIQLTSEQRHALYLGLENSNTQRAIASLIAVSPAAVSRELQRNKDKRGGYSWRLAHEMAMERRERLPGNRATPEWIKQTVIRLVRKDWSAGQISGHLRKKENIRVSHETIYK